jgi:hypothetical protein
LESAGQLYEEGEGNRAQYLFLLVYELLHLVLLQQGFIERLYSIDILVAVPHQINPTELPVCQLVHMHQLLKEKVHGLLPKLVLEVRDHFLFILLHLLYHLLERYAAD